jgi:methanogenic corrinoid protein MtbC1
MAHPPALAHYSTVPIFNTKAVVRDTGVPADTFRAWERRYGVPRPQRTHGGHRLYSERDIAIIRWLRERTEEGMNISHAVMLLANQPDVPAAQVTEEGARALDRLIEELVQALTDFDAQQAERVIGEAFALYPLEEVLLHMVQPALVEIGDRWHRGQITVAAEHFASQFVRRKLAGLLNVFEGGAQRPTIVIGCAPAELHDMGVLLLAIFLVRRGWHVVYLGAQVPLADLIETVRALNPALVGLSATTHETALQLREVGRTLVELFPHLRFGYGGRIFNGNPELLRSMPGMFLGNDAREVVDTIATVLAHHPTSTSE